MAESSQPILSRTFVILCGCTFLFFVSTSALVPVLPRHLKDLGAMPALIGLVTGIMAGPAIVTRPFVGRAIDRHGRKIAILAGFLINAVACLGYAAIDSIPAIFVIRLVHGVAFASFYPGVSTLAGDLAPHERRTETFSYFSMFLFAGTAVGPVLGEHLYRVSSAHTAFVFSAGLAVVGLIIATKIKEESRSLQQNHEVAPLLSRAAFFPAVILAFIAFPFGGVQAFLPLYADKVGGGDSRLYFAAFALTIMAMRVFVGRVADTRGKGAIIIPGALFSGISMLILVKDASASTLIASAVVFGVGWGALFPGLFAMTIDRVHQHQRGSATATFTSAFDLTFGGGQIALGAALQATNYPTIWVMGAISAFLGLIVYLMRRRQSDAAYPSLHGAASTSPVGDAASGSS